jgi:EAL domain-containing protein (putative c-di-GMP-specific phosphodiesterase class I)
MPVQSPQRQPDISLVSMTVERTKQILPFIVQPILKVSDAQPFGYEILYRGKRPVDWRVVDADLLKFLADTEVKIPLFVNLSNDSVMAMDEGMLMAAHERNSIYFEWSETINDDAEFRQVVEKISALSRRGLKFVIDDFGAGRDALQRLFAVEHVAAIKLDGSLVQLIPSNPMARSVVAHIAGECAKRGILTVGECIETQEQYDQVRQIGIDLVQGWFVDDLHAASAKEHSAASA